MSTESTGVTIRTDIDISDPRFRDYQSQFAVKIKDLPTIGKAALAFEFIRTTGATPELAPDIFTTAVNTLPDFLKQLGYGGENVLVAER